ncbi:MULTISPECIES: hypothetical protein [Clostridium]|uniref:Uncharacterized protein n=1 Tax=Clostridium saccharoperbutylacetonicum N1-4(HMT) TaxID=931276 RepID=M1M9Q7_9CLOT|nr:MULTISPECIES: hypothetical protein [Clostridium]AGF54689.1 hypothetical protein Cspa_c09130 [Clostridium saccharoperbutylacetonicum N1-4(HMT)]AQR93644.1 hypothetical protein CLSAP_09510 [Clostridium saccharoperbutylacetonicum]NRT58790.1 hypothetical protein [Clostridium saccharoperbutylacetonicum]NSB27979.1 hypothetical protein [Clostridium saccharoperbutylacetonicum]NSB29343.1 hypothetical protein [Clostridium saccharoperbutylacetonicum]
MKKTFKGYILRKLLFSIFVFAIILTGIIKINIINTKALSPLGNTNENYKIVSEEFGEDFSNFIKDNSFLKIYKGSQNDILIRLGNNDFRISDQSIFINKMQEIFEKIRF